MLFPRGHRQVWQKFVDTVTSGEPQVLGLVFGYIRITRSDSVPWFGARQTSNLCRARVVSVGDSQVDGVGASIDTPSRGTETHHDDIDAIERGTVAATAEVPSLSEDRIVIDVGDARFSSGRSIGPTESTSCHSPPSVWIHDPSRVMT